MILIARLCSELKVENGIAQISPSLQVLLCSTILFLSSFFFLFSSYNQCQAS